MAILSVVKSLTLHKTTAKSLTLHVKGKKNSNEVRVGAVYMTHLTVSNTYPTRP